MPAGGRRYKSWELYVCIALNRLVQELDIDLYQPELEDKLDHMEDSDMVRVESEGRSYRIYITKEGVIHARKYNEFYMMMYRDFLLDHYKYRQLPAWFKQ